MQRECEAATQFDHALVVSEDPRVATEELRFCFLNRKLVVFLESNLLS